MAMITFLRGNMCALEFVKKLPSLVFEELTEENELGVCIKTYSLAGDVMEAVSKAFKGETIVVYYNDELIYEYYHCERCGCTDEARYRAGCCYNSDETTDYYRHDDEI
jgi:hypothetical protein